MNNSDFASIIADLQAEKRSVTLYRGKAYDMDYMVSNLSDTLSAPEGIVKKMISSLGQNPAGGYTLFTGSAAECRSFASHLNSLGFVTRVSEDSSERTLFSSEDERKEAIAAYFAEATSKERERKQYQDRLRQGKIPTEVVGSFISLVQWSKTLNAMVAISPQAKDLLIRYTTPEAFRSDMEAGYSAEEISAAISAYESKADVNSLPDSVQVLVSAYQEYAHAGELLEEICSLKSASGGVATTPEEAQILLGVQYRMLWDLQRNSMQYQSEARDINAELRREYLSLLREVEQDDENLAIGQVPAFDIVGSAIQSGLAYTEAKIKEVRIFLRPI